MGASSRRKILKARSAGPANKPASRASVRDGPRRWAPWIVALLIAISALVVYTPAYRAGWSWDDDMSVYANDLVTRPGGLARIWLTTEDHDFWPLTRTAFWVEYRIFDGAPGGFHAINVILHALASVLVYLVLRRIGVPGAAFGGLVFALHPVNAATVVWIAELKNILSLIFFALTVLAWLRFERDRRWTSYVAALIAYTAALASKTSIATWPVMMLGWALWRRRRLTARDLVESAPFWALSIAMSAMTLFTQARDVAVLSRPLVGAEKLAGAGWVFWFYIYKALAPVNLSVVYPHWKDAIESLGWVAFVPTVVLVALVGLSWLKRSTVWGRALLLAEGFSLLGMLPVMGFFASTITMHSLVADHFQYVPIVAPIAIVCASGAALFREGKRAGVARLAIASSVVALLVWGTAARAGVLASEERLWTDTIARNPQAWVAHYNLATRLTERAQRLAGDLQQAWGERDIEARMSEVQALLQQSESHYRRSIQLQPLHVRSYSNLGLVLAGLGRDDDAIAMYRAGLAVDDRHYGGTGDYSLAINLGQALLRQRRFADAVPVCQRAVHLLPGDPAAASELDQALSGLAATGH